MEILYQLIQEVNFQYDFTIKCYLLDALFHITLLVTELLRRDHDLMLLPIQTT